MKKPGEREASLHQALGHLGRAAAEGGTEKAVLSAAVTVLAQGLELSSVTAYLCGEDGRARRHASVGALGRRPEVAMVERELTEKAVVVCRPVAALAGQPDRQDRQVRTVVHPLKPGVLVKGALAVSAHHKLTSSERELIDAVAGLVGSLFEREAAGQQMSLTSNRLIALISVAREMVGELEVPDLLHMVAETTLHVVQADTAAVYTVAPESRRLRLEAVIGRREHEVRAAGVRWAQGAVGRAWAWGQPVIGKPRRVSGSGKSGDGGSDGAQTLSTVAVPITYKDFISGVVYADALRSTPAFTEDDLDVLSLLAGFAGSGLENARAFDDLRDMYVDTMQQLVDLCEKRDHEMQGHASRVAKHAVRIGKEMGLSREDLKTLQHASLLHDVGMSAMDERVLAKDGPLSQTERRLIQKHPEIGAGRLSPIEVLSDLVPIVRSHHERVDGYGYPDGLVGDSIPLAARILSVADAYSAMTHPRRYRGALSTKQAIEELKSNSEGQFDPDVVNAFVAMLERKGRRKAPVRGGASRAAAGKTGGSRSGRR